MEKAVKIQYIDGYRFYNAIRAGAEAIIQNQDYLNNINVFPVPDSDTGTNMASTMQSILDGCVVSRSLKKTISSIADSALFGSQGNSGIIFAQFIYGLSEELAYHNKVSAEIFASSVNNSIRYVYESILEPAEGTIITVMRDWAKAIQVNSRRTNDFVHILSESLKSAKESLSNTPKLLKALSDAGVVDAGGKGFVYFLEGVSHFIQNGKIKRIIQNRYKTSAVLESVEHNYNPGDSRYCTEAILTNSSYSLKDVQQRLKDFGNSLIVAGSQKKLHLHIHTDHPEKMFEKVAEIGSITRIKVDDMKLQYQVSHNRKFPIAIITDTACDLPKEIIEKYQIFQIPFNINFGKNVFLDKLTINANQFYKKLQVSKHHPKSSQPTIITVRNLYSFLSSQYKDILAIHISDKLTGLYKISKQMEKIFKNNDISVYNSKQLTVSEGLIVLRVAKAIEKGESLQKIKSKINEWIKKTDILVDVDTLKYMVRGGRVSPVKGFIASAMNIKPIISLDDEGKAIAVGKSFSRRGNLIKILKILQEKSKKNKIWNYAIVHADAESRAQIYAEKLTKIIGKKPAYVMELSPVVGVHNGIGTVGIGIMEE